MNLAKVLGFGWLVRLEGEVLDEPHPKVSDVKFCSVGIFLIKEKIFESQGVTQKIHKNFTFELSDNKPNCFEVFSEIHKSLNKFALNRSVTLHKNSTIFSPYCTTNIHSPLCTYCTMDWYSHIFGSITLNLVTFNPKIGSNHP